MRPRGERIKEEKLRPASGDTKYLRIIIKRGIGQR